MINWNLFIRLALAHALADFALNPKRMAGGKRSSSFSGRMAALTLHAGINAAAALLFVWDLSLRGITIAGITFLTHFLIDYARRLAARRFYPGKVADISKVHVLKIMINPRNAPPDPWWRKNVKAWMITTLADQSAHLAVIIALATAF